MQAGITVLFNKPNRCAKLSTNELLVLSWAWDSNSLPGEYTDTQDRPCRWPTGLYC